MTAGSGNLMRSATEMSQNPLWPSLKGLDLTVAVLFIQLIAKAALLAQVLGPFGMATGIAGFAAFIYSGAVSAGQHTASRALGWIGAPWRHWVGAIVAGCLLATIVTSATIALGHSIRVTAAFHDRVLAVTLGPIVEEICLRGLLVPLLARVVGSAGAVLVTSALFAFLHWPASYLKLASITVTGAAYGWIRVRSGSTALSAIAHAIYNLTLLGFGTAGSGR